MNYSISNISQQLATFFSNSTSRDIPEVVKRIFNFADEHFSQLIIPDHAQLPFELVGERVWPIWQWLKRVGTAEMAHKLLRCYWRAAPVILDREQNLFQLRPDFAEQLFDLRSEGFSMQMLLDLLTIRPNKEIVIRFTHRLYIHFKAGNPIPLLEPYFCKLYQLEWKKELTFLVCVMGPDLTWVTQILTLAFRYVDDETLASMLGQLSGIAPIDLYMGLMNSSETAVRSRIVGHPFFSQCVQ